MKKQLTKRVLSKKTKVKAWWDSHPHKRPKNNCRDNDYTCFIRIFLLKKKNVRLCLPAPFDWSCTLGGIVNVVKNKKNKK